MHRSLQLGTASVPKSAGTSLSHLFSKAFGKRFQHFWSPAQVKSKVASLRRRRAAMIFGHLPYGVHKVLIDIDQEHALWLNKLNFTYATVLRHPLERVKSHYHFHRVSRSDANHRWARDRDLAAWTGFMEDSKDCSVAHIAGVHSKAWWNARDQQLLPPRKDKQPPRSGWVVTHAHYRLARWNLVNMGWVGVFDRLQQSVDQLRHFWNIEKTAIGRKNRNRKKPNSPLSERERDRILEFNTGDAWLYELAVVLFEQQQLVLKYLGV